MLAGATCRAEVNCTQYDNSVPNTDGCAQSVDHHLQVTLLQMQCSADSRRRVEFAWHVQNWRQHLGDDEPFIADELTDLKTRPTRKLCTWMDIPAGKFWCCCWAQFPNFAKKAFEVPVPFVTTYRHEQSFPVMIAVQNKQRNRSEAMFAPGLLKDRAPNYEVGGESHKILKNSKSNLLNVLLKEKRKKKLWK